MMRSPGGNVNRQTTQPRIDDQMSSRREAHLRSSAVDWTTYGIKDEGLFGVSARSSLNLL